MSKIEKLKEFISKIGKNGVVVMFSGGVDSVTLTKLCKDVIKRVFAVTVVSEVLSKYDVEYAKSVAKEIGVDHYILEIDLLNDENFVRNDENRCYFCKKKMIRMVKEFASAVGVECIVEGTNVSELNEYRPGYRAVVEEGVYSPWIEVGIDKEEIRSIAKKLGLSVHDNPPTTCLATRIPFGHRITHERLRRIEKAESIVRDLDFKVVRVRDYGDIAIVEVGREERSKFFNVDLMDYLSKSLKDLGYKYVTLNLEGYSRF
ncbi:ATP-dependent sacrificial sulfur transferase LarE [Archaeoglobus profundus]|uniref:ExsB family protein n=1 Tax=Archaeoglobus profundus (strain DSM 5631 / JCM 9629 / NBRC 100127 / Av18) TaxID=572546 RepID=D2RFP8_ARCPA|nr:ATP-dependent sacrificial sulfur transferase LarE [Archaeoglobus profundus]ADB57123.1 ExsB family protein [Archaeoglobus profundus DSM 5631]